MNRRVYIVATVVGVLGMGLGLAGAFGEVTGKARTSALGYRASLLVQMRVSDLDRAVAFYRDVLDFDVVLRSDELQWAELSFGLEGVEIGLGGGAEAKGSGSVSLNIGVKDIAAARALLEKRGVVFKGETMTIPDKVRLADFRPTLGTMRKLVHEGLAGSRGMTSD